MNLRADRINRGLSIDDVAEATGVHARVVRRAEDGHMPRPANAKALADFYGVKVTDIWPVDRQAA